MGALAFEPTDDAPDDHEELPLAQLARDAAAVLTDEHADEALRHMLLPGGSPQGSRPKVLVDYDANNGTVSTANSGKGEPWLVKFPVGDEHRDASATEALYARLATRCGLAMPASRFF